MGYTTDFTGSMKITKNPITQNSVAATGSVNTNLNIHQACALINGLADSRRVQRDLSLIADTDGLIDGIHYTAYGVDGEFYISTLGYKGQTDDASVINHNKPSATQPSLWLQWITTPNDENSYSLAWDDGEKFYYYTEWLQYIIDSILIPNNLVINGVIHWEGEDRDDIGTLCCINNILSVAEGEHTEAFVDADLC